jgi:hypothetical protein
MDMARQIVLMLIQRKRSAYRAWKAVEARGLTALADQYYTEYNEAHNAAEMARRLLYRGTTEL